MTKKIFINISIIIGAVIIAGMAVYFFIDWKIRGQFGIIPAIKRISTIPDSAPYAKDGTCPLGYVDYGIPLQCVTPGYMEYCNEHSCPICLSGDALIETPVGLISVQDLRIGMPVWTADEAGRRFSGIVMKTSMVPAPPEHQMVHLVFDDGRELFVSPGHPTAGKKTVGDIIVNDFYDGARVISSDLVEYGDTATYDILPSGKTGFYWANGILLGSTLH